MHCLRYGPDELPQTFWIRWAKYDEAVDVADDEQSEAPTASEDGEARLPPPSEPEQPGENVEVLRTEMRDGMAQMRSLLESLAGAPRPQGVPPGGAEAGPAEPASGSATGPLQATMPTAVGVDLGGPSPWGTSPWSASVRSCGGGLSRCSRVGRGRGRAGSRWACIFSAR